MSYITKKLSLSDKEAQKFWSIYPQYLNELSIARHNYPQGSNYRKEQIDRIKKDYSNKFFLILKDSNRVDKVFFLEKNYREMLKQEVRKRVNPAK